MQGAHEMHCCGIWLQLGRHELKASQGRHTPQFWQATCRKLGSAKHSEQWAQLGHWGGALLHWTVEVTVGGIWEGGVETTALVGGRVVRDGGAEILEGWRVGDVARMVGLVPIDSQ